jgi:3-methyl-2-oxobutanoate hydroxymethyltransferase
MSVHTSPPAAPHALNGRAPRSTVADFTAKRTRGERLVVVTAYDAMFARLVDESGVDAILVGDSVGNVVSGYDSTVPVTLDQMIYHAAAVKRGSSRALLIVDMPFLTYQVTIERALLNCGRVFQEGGAQAVKIEGGTREVAATVQALVRAGMPVMAHLGYTPQYANALSGPRVQARQPSAADDLVDSAKRLEDAGAFAINLELIPASVAARVTETVGIPTIGIGAGPECSGQVLVLYDLLGLNDTFTPRFLKRYATLADDVRGAIRAFGSDVRSGGYPDAAHSF